jgi:hypothetical protein
MWGPQSRIGRNLTRPPNASPLKLLRSRVLALPQQEPPVKRHDFVVDIEPEAAVCEQAREGRGTLE